MLFKISLNNLRRSFRDYTIYFFTLIIGVSIFYVFNAIGTQAAMMRISQSTREIIRLMTELLSEISVFVALVLGLLIVYASRFMMKRRSREFAIYLTLGMSKSRISFIIMLETLLIGICSLGAGLIAGIGFSQLTSAIVANMFEADMTAYRFTLSGEAVLKTIEYFGLIYLVVMLVGSFSVGKMKLIDLIQSGSKSEKLSLKNPWLCTAVFAISSVALGYAYYRIQKNALTLETNEFMLMVAIGSAATCLIFWSLSGLLLRIVMSFKRVYFRGLGCFTFRQISSRVNTMVISMTVICLMLFITICSLASSFSVSHSMRYNLKKLCPADCEILFERFYDNDGDRLKHTQADVIQCFTETGYDLPGQFEDYVHFSSYIDRNFTLESFLGTNVGEVTKAYPLLMIYTPEEIVRLSDYNKLMKLYGKQPLVLDDDEFILLCNFESSKAVRDATLYKGMEISLFGHTLRSRYDVCQDGFINLSSVHENDGVFVVPDDAVDSQYTATNYFIGNYNAANADEYEKTDSEITTACRAVISRYTNEDSDILIGGYDFITKNTVKESSVGLGAIVTFLGLYIGLIFLVSCGVLLALKELSGSVDSIPRYVMLRKLGVDESDISRSLLMQTGVFFLLPLLLACIHSIFGMKYGITILQLFGTEKLTESVILTSLVILLIYGGYFLMTYFCSRSIIREQRQ